jgi:hypothetical protein
MLKLGKGDAVRKGFAAASGDILMILDSDISVAPEDLTKFYEVLATGKARFANDRQRFGDFDPFGDFDLLFGAAWLRQKIVDVPVRYWARVYGESKVRVAKHGPLLIQMSLIALWHFKIKPLFAGEKAVRPVTTEVKRPDSRLPLAFLALAVIVILLTRVRRKD